jgi:hypothetical protein
VQPFKFELCNGKRKNPKKTIKSGKKNKNITTEFFHPATDVKNCLSEKQLEIDKLEMAKWVKGTARKSV